MGSHFGVGAPSILVYFSGDWDVHWGYGILPHGHLGEFFFLGIGARDAASVYFSVFLVSFQARPWPDG